MELQVELLSCVPAREAAFSFARAFEALVASLLASDLLRAVLHLIANPSQGQVVRDQVPVALLL